MNDALRDEWDKVLEEVLRQAQVLKAHPDNMVESDRYMKLIELSQAFALVVRRMEGR